MKKYTTTTPMTFYATPMTYGTYVTEQLGEELDHTGDDADDPDYGGYNDEGYYVQYGVGGVGTGWRGQTLATAWWDTATFNKYHAQAE